jgi:hypothetical protein
MSSLLWPMGMKSCKQISLCEQQPLTITCKTTMDMDILKAITIMEKVIVRFKFKI